MNTKEQRTSVSALRDLALEANLRYYEEHAAEFADRTRGLALHEIYTPFVGLIPEGSAILDAGCGSGRDSLEFRKRGYRMTAIDGSPAMVRETKKLGLEAEVMNLQDMTYCDQFEGIWACASLLHIPKSEIAEVLKRLACALKGNGILFVSMKEGDGQRVAEDGRFFSYFRLEEFSELLKEAGFIVLRAARAAAENGGEWLNFLARKQ